MWWRGCSEFGSSGNGSMCGRFLPGWLFRFFETSPFALIYWSIVAGMIRVRLICNWLPVALGNGVNSASEAFGVKLAHCAVFTW